jgi:hypothetical protein
MFDQRELRKIFGPKRKKVKGNWRKYIVRSFTICTPLEMLFG